MTPQLQVYAEQDHGYFQFCKQYDRAAADPATMTEFRNWFLDELREEGMRIAAIEEGMARGMAKGIEQGAVKEREKLKPIMQSLEAEVTRLRALLAEKT